MSEMAAFMALIETASAEGITTRRRYLKENGPHEVGWNYDNILEVERSLVRQLGRKGFFRIYLYAGNGGGNADDCDPTDGPGVEVGIVTITRDGQDIVIE